MPQDEAREKDVLMMVNTLDNPLSCSIKRDILIKFIPDSALDTERMFCYIIFSTNERIIFQKRSTALLW